MARILGYMAASLDGYIATPDGGVDWLEPFQGNDYGYDRFIAGIGTVVLGRTTFDQAMAFGWPYAGRRGLVVTSRPLPDPPPGVSAWTGGLDALIRQLRGQGDGDAWIVGGAGLQAAFIAAGALDRLELFVMPVLLGDGIPLWPKGTRAGPMGLEDASVQAGGVARLVYRATAP